MLNAMRDAMRTTDAGCNAKHAMHVRTDGRTNERSLVPFLGKNLRLATRAREERSMIEQTNNDAEIVPCRYCGARAQQHCINNITNEPLRNNASHIRRAVDAMHAADARNDDADEELF